MKSFVNQIIICIFALCLYGVGISAQNIVREGNTFTQTTAKRSSENKEIKTEYLYKDSKGNEYPVYLSSTGKAFIKKVSKKTNKEYRQYIPEIGKQINPEAYKKEDKK